MPYKLRIQKGDAMNKNHPEAGSIISVEPIRNVKDIVTIKKMLAGNARDYALFVVGINTAFRASDLLALSAGAVRHLSPGDTLAVREKKTGKERRVTLNNAAYTAINALLATLSDAADTDPLFQSRKGSKALTVPTLNNLVKAWCEAINLHGNYGSHTLRKTFGLHQRIAFNTDIPTLMTMFGHSTQKQTLHYLGIQADEVRDAYMNEL